jgi:hypothetical protein
MQKRDFLYHILSGVAFPMPLHYVPPPTTFVRTINDNEKEERDATHELLRNATTGAFGYRVLFEDFWDLVDSEDDDDEGYDEE